MVKNKTPKKMSLEETLLKEVKRLKLSKKEIRAILTNLKGANPRKKLQEK